MPCIARRDGRFFPCDPICSRFWYDKQDIWTKGFSTESPSQREDETKDVQAVVQLGFSVRHFCLCVCWTCWSWFYCYYFFFFFLVCVFSAGFKGKAPKRSTKSKEPGQEGGCLLCKHFGHQAKISVWQKKRKEGEKIRALSCKVLHPVNIEVSIS